MASRVTERLLFVQDENQVAPRKKATVDGATRSSKTVAKKGEGSLGSRKALQDITNKSSLHPEASIKKKNPQKEEFNVAEEMFLHDHQKCIEAKQAAFNNFDLNLVLPGHGRSESEEAKAEADYDSPRCYPEPSELPMDEFSDCFEYSTQCSSPPCSPMLWDTPTSCEYVWQFEDVEFVLQQEADF
ncbi:protein PATRONUS 2 isoform X2 [Rhodamnia argentea]|uniref:Protein PATRONUS 2 isoform X2 n=1 Tax=Rhodamnia argentea TaxID=178133 RepID=A0A8B8NL18_9MYRT|nr:protein PATRONUS 2 isoform X2 [Rhodamnia argentea]